jgi:lysozyme
VEEAKRAGYDRLRAELIQDEGEYLKPYVDCCRKTWRECACEVKGDLTIGVGRNLDKVGISQLESRSMLATDIYRAIQDGETLPWFKSLSVPRQDVVLNMLFNMGKARFLGFKKAVAAIVEGNFNKAADELLDSKWKTQVKDRAKRLANRLRTGLY